MGETRAGRAGKGEVEGLARVWVICEEGDSPETARKRRPLCASDCTREKAGNPKHQQVAQLIRVELG